jgi:FKBP-type peptidyl-prolyl cis-trans isomerase SlpA
MPDGTIHENSAIVLHFALKLADGEVVDSNFGREPARCKLGDGSLLPTLERLLIGLRAGDRREFSVAPEDGFGQRNPDNIQTFKRAHFSGMALDEGLVVSFADASNSELPGVVTRVDNDQVTVDFNHPLAGSDLLFEVQILEVN